jgi:hypothetical protein
VADLNKSIQPDSQIWFLSGTGIENYENQIDFRNTGVRRQFMQEHLLFTVNNYRYVRKNQTILINKNVEQCYNIDYCYYKNRNFGDREIFCFVTDVNYVNDETTEISIEVDAWTTFQFDIKFKKCFIMNQHEQEFANNNYDLHGGALVGNNLYPENLEFGGNYVNVHTESYHWKLPYLILLCSSVELDGDFGSKNSPNINSSHGTVCDNIPSMLSYYILKSGAEFENLAKGLSNAPWIAQNIQFVTMIPTEFLDDSNLRKIDISFSTGTKVSVYKIKDNYISPEKDILKVDNVIEKFGLKQEHFKLYQYPYSYIEMTGYNGQQFIIKPELLSDKNVIDLQGISYISSAPRFCVYPKGYANYSDNGFKYGNLVTQGDFINSGIIFGNFPQIPVLVDNSILYQAQNANSFALNNAIANYNKKEARFFAPIETGMGVVSNALKGNIGGVISSLYGGAKKVYETDKQSEITIRKQMAKIQDAEITPPTLAGQTGGDGFNIANGFGGITLKWKTIHPTMIERLNSFFERYGYVSNRFEFPKLRTCERFNYIKTQGCIIEANIPKSFAEIIQNMFDKGVTLWHDGDIGVYTTNKFIGD